MSHSLENLRRGFGELFSKAPPKKPGWTFHVPMLALTVIPGLILIAVYESLKGVMEEELLVSLSLPICEGISLVWQADTSYLQIKEGKTLMEQEAQENLAQAKEVLLNKTADHERILSSLALTGLQVCVSFFIHLYFSL